MAIQRFFAFHQPLQRLCITGLLACLLCFSLVTPAGSAAPLSPVKGLMALKTMAQQAVPYEIARVDGKPTVLEFYADWCSSCQSMAPVMMELHGHYGDRINFVMVNIDDAQAAAAVKEYGVTGIPHLLTLASNGEVMAQFVGRVPGQLLDRAIASLWDKSGPMSPSPISPSLSSPNLS